MKSILSRIIGLVKGPGTSPHTFEIVSADKERRLKIGEFVTYTVDIDEQEREVLARVSERQPLRLFPTGFLADPDLSPDFLASSLGYGGERPELFKITVDVLGYFDTELCDFINPRVTPKIGSPVTLASDEFLTTVLNRRKIGGIGGAHIGSLLSRSKGQVPIVIDLEAICSTHLAIIANTGAGKSYLAGVLVEELLSSHNRAAILIIDPHGEYNTLTEMHSLLASEEYTPEVSIYRPGEVKIRIGSLSLADLRYLLPDMSERMEYVLRLAVQRVVRKSRQKHAGDPDRWRLDELVEELKAIGHLEDPENDDSENADDSGKYKDTADAVIWRLNTSLRNSQIFDNLQQVNLQDLIRPGKCAVLQLNEVDSRQQQVIVATLLRKLYQARIQTQKGQTSETNNKDFYLPYPVFILIEEAHHFTPAKGDAISTEILRQILAEGRKFGIGVGLISQRPGKLDADALSQCNTQFLLRIVNPVDQARVRESVETVGQELINELPALTKGQAIVAGAAVNAPLLCQIRSRITSHGADDISAPKEWMTYFSQAEITRRERITATVELNRPKSRKTK